MPVGPYSYYNIHDYLNPPDGKFIPPRSMKIKNKIKNKRRQKHGRLRK